MKAQTVIDVILGEAVHGTNAQRYEDMLGIASVIYNRSVSTSASPRAVVAAKAQFDAYNKNLPDGADKYRSLAEKAWKEVQTKGPVHKATYYATPTATKNLPDGLEKVTQTKGHVYFEDPQNRPVVTTEGAIRPDPSALAAVQSAPSVEEFIANNPQPGGFGLAGLAYDDPNMSVPTPTPRPRGSGGLGMAALEPAVTPAVRGAPVSRSEGLVPYGVRTAENAAALDPYLTPDKGRSHLQFNNDFGSRLEKFLADAPGGGIKVYSGFRSIPHQAELFRDAVKKYGSVAAARRNVAPPGKSNHNFGKAADLRYATPEARQWAHDNARKYGLHFRIGHEPWHIEPLPGHAPYEKQDVPVPTSREQAYAMAAAQAPELANARHDASLAAAGLNQPPEPGPLPTATATASAYPGASSAALADAGLPQNVDQRIAEAHVPTPTYSLPEPSLPVTPPPVGDTTRVGAVPSGVGATTSAGATAGLGVQPVPTAVITGGPLAPPAAAATPAMGGLASASSRMGISGNVAATGTMPAPAPVPALEAPREVRDYPVASASPATVPLPDTGPIPTLRTDYFPPAPGEYFPPAPKAGGLGGMLSPNSALMPFAEMKGLGGAVKGAAMGGAVGGLPGAVIGGVLGSGIFKKIFNNTGPSGGTPGNAAGTSRGGYIGSGVNAMASVFSGRTAPGTVAASRSTPGVTAMSLPGGLVARSAPSSKHGYITGIYGLGPPNEHTSPGAKFGKVAALSPDAKSWSFVSPDEAKGLQAKGWTVSIGPTSKTSIAAPAEPSKTAKGPVTAAPAPAPAAKSTTTEATQSKGLAQAVAEVGKAVAQAFGLGPAGVTGVASASTGGLGAAGMSAGGLGGYGNAGAGVGVGAANYGGGFGGNATADPVGDNRA